MEKVVFLRLDDGCPKGYPCVDRLDYDTALTVGVFDGVHLGHVHLLKRLVKVAERKNLMSCVLSFYPHPARVLAPSQAPCELTTVEERAELILATGVDTVVFIKFDRRFSSTKAEDFIRDVVHHRLRCKHLLVGYDWRYGFRREGEIELARELGKDLGFEVEGIEPFQVKGHVVSSTLIRRLLHEGRLEEAKEFLGRYYYIVRRVVRGEGRGSSIGVPTANLDHTENLCLKEGVYAVMVNDHLPGVANYGYRPTFDGKRKTLEVHIIGSSVNVRGKWLKVEFRAFLREERKFQRVEELREQIQKDISTALAILSK
ncbi:riboflavin biosynthesis protein RibF [Thermocrinis albus DSM 14484]|uniref:Riboflavin biosynthesis protein n=1 Tax=Thermocrinis albus (strain DSM 14484 / JCM 11386 / HI 11/12) TaxID=638303 RepID=D3SQ40_THEAH|nr:bifunctional riboflavin kinase/FAD synthetase [Thermocrinis albus]ADC89277.1 riboflavin biosynthesis protein RibF [Thermocrinis albus DSM 14484]